MDEQIEGRIEAFTENVVQVIGTGLPGATLRMVIDGLATRFALDVQRDATTTASVPAAWVEKVQKEMKPQEAEQADPPEGAKPVDPPDGTPWGDDQPKPEAALMAQDIDPT